MTISLSYLRSRWLGSALVVASLALGIATITFLMLVMAQFELRMERDARGIDLVAGAKGSPLQIILSAIYHLDAPTGNISVAQANEISGHRMVKKTVPLALGDSYRGARIVGTNQDYLQLYDARIERGALWAKPMDAVLGSDVSRRLGLELGATVHAAHGLAEGGEQHGGVPYRVVGILAPTGSVIDRVILTSIESVWFVHEHDQGSAEDYKPDPSEREFTALLIQYATPLAAATLPRYINANSEMQSAAPAHEIGRLYRVLGVGVNVMRAFAVVLVLGAVLGVFVALYHALEERRYDLAIMRTLGASPSKLMGLLLLEGLMLAGAGAVMGMALGHLATGALGLALQQASQPAVSGWVFAAQELWLLALTLILGTVASAIPAWRAYRTDIASTLAAT